MLSYLKSVFLVLAYTVHVFLPYCSSQLAIPGMQNPHELINKLPWLAECLANKQRELAKAMQNFPEVVRCVSESMPNVASENLEQIDPSEICNSVKTAGTCSKGLVDNVERVCLGDYVAGKKDIAILKSSLIKHYEFMCGNGTTRMKEYLSAAQTCLTPSLNQAIEEKCQDNEHFSLRFFNFGKTQTVFSRANCRSVEIVTNCSQELINKSCGQEKANVLKNLNDFYSTPCSTGGVAALQSTRCWLAFCVAIILWSMKVSK